MKSELKIRFAKRNDLPFIVDIYNQAIRSNSATGDLTEFSVEQRLDWFNKFDNEVYPIYITEIETKVVGYCTISPYRQGREAMSSVAEISYYIDYSYHNKGIGSKMFEYVIADCNRIGKENLLAILLDINPNSVGILEKFNFKKWGHFPDVININGKKCGHLIYGLKINKTYT
jgi:L-amino acid N-acyltransferase YncA